MTVTTTSSQTTLGGNGSTTVFSFSFIAGVPSNLLVTYTNTSGNETTLTLGSGSGQYQVTLNAAAPGQLWGIGGTVTYNPGGTPIANGTSLTITRIVPLTQAVSIQNQAGVYLQVIEQAMDTLCLELQQVSARTGQYRGTWATTIAYNYGDVIVDGANGANTTNYYMCIIPNTSGTWSTDLAAGDWTLFLNIAGFNASVTAAAASATAAASSASAASSSATSAATSATTATTEAGVATTQATNASNSATAAASSATSASTSAATATSEASTATTQAGIATTQATNAAASASTASNAATNAASSATSASGSATAASTSATTATTQAGNAATSATAAAGSASSASTSATTATTQAGIATTQATNASTSATNAATSATNAASSATSASTSASTATTEAGTATTQAGNAATSATAAAGSATAAAASAASLAAGITATSTTSLLIATGAQTFTTQSGKLFINGQILIIASNANSANYMHGAVTSYTGTSLVMSITDTGGSGTFADWNISISGTQGTLPGGIVAVTNGGTGVTTLPALGVELFPQLNSTAISSITTTAFAGLTSTQLGSLVTTAFSGITSSQVAALTSTVARTLGSSILPQLTSTAVGSLTTTALAGLTSTQLAALTTTQLTGLAPNLVNPLNARTTAWMGGLNKFRNANFAVAQRGTGTFTVTTAGAYTLDGWFVTPTGASCTTDVTGNEALSTAALRVHGATGVTDITVKQRIESYDAAYLTNGNDTGPPVTINVTVQLAITNNTGNTVTPLLTIKVPSSADNWSSGLTTIVNGVSMQSVASGGHATLAYCFTSSNGQVSNGIEVTFDFGNNFGTSGQNLFFYSPDIRATPGTPVGLVSSPPLPEFINTQAQLAWCQRFFYSFGGALTANWAIGGGDNITTAATYVFQNPVPMRVAPTGITFNGTASHWQNNATAVTGFAFATGTQTQLSITASSTVLATGAYVLNTTASANGTDTFYVTGAEL